MCPIPDSGAQYSAEYCSHLSGTGCARVSKQSTAEHPQKKLSDGYSRDQMNTQ